MNYYNEFDPFAAAWLQRLIDEGLIPPGYVDIRSITEVQPEDVIGFTQCHFFAGIGGWSYALQLAGWSEDRPVWTGSCPCQPFSTAGKRQGVDDERHLWPEFARLIGECQPPVVFGEQVASKDGRIWLAGVRADLEEMGYAVGAADLCAAGIGAPHIRQRLYWGGVADTSDLRRQQRREAEGTAVQGERTERGGEHPEPRDAGELAWGSEGLRSTGGVAHSESQQSYGGRTTGGRRKEPTDSRADGGVGHTLQPGLEGLAGDGVHLNQPGRQHPRQNGSPAPSGVWADAEWIACADGKFRRIEPGIPLLAHGIPNRVGRLRGFGNAIVPPLAAEFVQAFEEARA